MEKREVIGQLYALRAGLSVLSQVYDEIIKLQPSQDKRFEKIIKLSRSPGLRVLDSEIEIFSHAYYMFYECEHTVKDSLNKFFDSIEYKSDEEKEVKLSCFEENFSFKRFVGIDYTLMLSHLKELEKAEEEYNKGIDRYGDAYITGTGFDKIHAAGTAAYKEWMKTEECYHHYSTVYSELQKVLAEQNQTLAKLRKKPFRVFRRTVKEQLKNQTMYHEATQIISQRIGSIKALFEQWQAEDKPIKAKTELAQRDAIAYFNALCEQFSPVLDMRDWKYLDLVLFYLETRRADTLKEALQQVDTEVRARRLAGTIKEAMAQLQDTVSIGFVSIRGAIETCSAKLSAQLASQHSELSAQLASQHEQTSAQLAQANAQLSQLTDAAHIGNALQAKANVTSEQLMHDIHYIRTAAF